MPRRAGLRLLQDHRKWFWALAAVVTAADQYTKYVFAWPTARLEDPIDILPVLRLLRRPLNLQGAFSLGPRGVLFYVVLTVVGLLLITYLFIGTDPKHLRALLALGMLCGGATGNLMDRLALGGVRDFIDLHWFDHAHWPTFNIADTAICVGVALLALDALRPAGSTPQQDAARDTA